MVARWQLQVCESKYQGQQSSLLMLATMDLGTTHDLHNARDPWVQFTGIPFIPRVDIFQMVSLITRQHIL